MVSRSPVRNSGSIQNSWYITLCNLPGWILFPNCSKNKIYKIKITPLSTPLFMSIIMLFISKI